MSFTAFALVVGWWENVANLDGTKGCCGMQPLQGLGRDGVDLDTRWPFCRIALCGLTESDPGVVHGSSSLKMGSVQRLLKGLCTL
jgi:hypothetical protein